MCIRKAYLLNVGSHLFFGLEKLIDLDRVNYGQGDEKSLLLSIEYFDNIRKKIIDLAANTRIIRINWLIDKSWRLFTKRPKNLIPPILRSQIWNEITSDEKKIGDKYTFIDQVNSIVKVYLRNFFPNINAEE